MQEIHLSENDARLLIGCLGYVQGALDDLERSNEIQACRDRMQTVWLILGDSVPGPYNLGQQAGAVTNPFSKQEREILVRRTARFSAR